MNSKKVLKKYNYPRGRILLMVLLLTGAGLPGFTQSPFNTFISNARENSKIMEAAQQLYEAELIAARMGNSPANPEIEYAHLWGNPDVIGNRNDFAVTQSFDFPTAYTSRSKLSRINQEQASYRLKTTVQEITVRARKAWIKAVYFNQRKILLDNKLKNAELIADAYQRMYDEGEANQLEINQSKVNVTALKNEMKRLELDILANEAQIKLFNSGEPVVIIDTVFPPSGIYDLDTLILHYLSGPLNLMYQGEIDRMEQSKDVIVNQKLPKLKVGYYQENILGTSLKGITAGITIPLWEDANSVKTARAELAYAETDADRFWERQELIVRQLYNQWLILKEQVIEMHDLCEQSNNEEILIKALEAGEISLTQYYYESDFYFQNQFDLLDFQKDLYLTETELLRVTY